jgi:N-acetylated-alpha-linked acidic dipeptidase
VYAAVSDPRRPTYAPEEKPVPPELNFTPLDNAISGFEKSAAAYDAAASDPAKPHTVADLKNINLQLVSAERMLTDDGGLPRRPWYKHLIYAPGWYTGYGAKTLPGIREAIEQERYDEADREIQRVAQALEREANYLDRLTAELK